MRLWNCGWKRHFEGTLRHVALCMRRRGIILLPVSDLTTTSAPAWSKTYAATEFWLKTQFYGLFEPFFTAHSLKRPFDPACRKTDLFKKSWLKTRFCRYFFAVVKILPCSLYWIFSAHARKTGSCYPISLPSKLVLTILIPNHYAKFGDDQLKIKNCGR